VDRTLSAFLRDRFGELDAQALMIAGEVVVSSPPLEVLAELGDIMSRTPGAASKLGNALTDGKVGALDKGGCDVGLRT